MLTYHDICRAATVLAKVTHVTPIMTSRQLDHASGATVFLKCENFQRVGSFKFRGAYHAVATLSEEERRRPVFTLSSGNHAQGLALACRLHGAAAHIVMPLPINQMKREAVVGYGATVHEAIDRAEAERLLRRLLEEQEGLLVHPFDDERVMAGQGTIMLELSQQVSDVQIVLAPVGGGGLLSGLAVAAHALNPHIGIYACEPFGALDAMPSVQQNRIVPMANPQTIAEGLRATVGCRTLPILREHLTGFFVVQETEILSAMRFAYERLKLVIEPSSAVALAPLLRREPALVGARVAVILTGGNVDLTTYWDMLRQRIIARN